MGILNAGTRTGSCYCGALTYRLDAQPQSVCLCHCRSCQRASGAPFVGWLTVPVQAWHITSGRLTWVEKVDGVKRGFCGQCGTPLSYQTNARPNDMDITLNSLSDPNLVKPERHIWVSHKVAWVQLSDGLPQFSQS